MLTASFDEHCRRLETVRGALVHTLTAQHASALQRQAVAIKGLQRDLHALQADMESVKEGLMEQLEVIDNRSKPHWKLVPLQRVATTTEHNAVAALQAHWRQRRRHSSGGRGWRYLPPAERWAEHAGAQNAVGFGQEPG